MADEMKREAEQKKQDYEMFALAANERTNPVLLDHLQGKESTQEEEIEWITPKNEEEAQELVKSLGGLFNT